VVLEITERDMLRQNEAVKLFQWLHDEGLKLRLMISAPVTAR
jgi:EAL domain-containing protein (putative c-di-GMP-specific phosphodiesterase class I)